MTWLRKAWRWIATGLAAMLGIAVAIMMPLYAREKRRRKAAESRAMDAEIAADVARSVAEAYRRARDDAAEEIERSERKYRAQLAKLEKRKEMIADAKESGSGASALNAAFGSGEKP